MMQLAFKQNGTGFVSWMIRRRTNGKFSHVELVFSDGLSFSAHEFEGGTRFKRIKYEAEPNFWELVPVRGIDSEQEAHIRLWCEEQTGKGYDFRGIIRFFLGMKRDTNNTWYCSEVCLAALKVAGKFLHVPDDASPQTLWIAARTAADLTKGQ